MPGRTSRDPRIAANLIALAWVLRRGVSFSTAWYTQPGFIAGMAAIPFVTPFLFGIVLLRRAGDRQLSLKNASTAGAAPKWFLAGAYSPAPIITIGMVGVADPCSGSTVIAKALASAPVGNGGCITVALP